MNNNETSILPHTVALALVQQVDELTETYFENEGIQLSTAGILLSAVETITDCQDYELEVRITKDGYQIAFPQSKSADDVLADFDQAFEALFEN